MYFSSNIKLLRKRRNKTQDELARELDMKRSTLSGYENGISQPTVQALIFISKYFGVSTDTLLNINLFELTDGQIKQIEQGSDVYVRGGDLRVLATTVGEDNEENIELVSEKAKAGYAAGFADVEYIKELPVFRLPFLSSQKKYRTFQLNGDSMLPIPHKAWVTGEYVQDWRHIVSGHAYVVLTLNDGIVFKIVENLLDSEGKFRLYSLNPMYQPFDVFVGDIKEMWKFVNYISEELPEPSLPQEELLKTVAKLKQDIDRLKK